MKNHELLDLIGEANEDYVLAAGDKVVRPRFRWKTLAACAACAALVLGGGMVWQGQRPVHELVEEIVIPIHGYTIVEGGILDTENEKVPAFGGESAPAPNADIPMGKDDAGSDSIQETGTDGIGYNEPGQDAPAQEEAAAQYDNLMKNGGINDAVPNPEWYGGAWLDNDWPDNTARLTVAIVESFRTPELEAQILDWCGGTGDVLFCGAKYSLTHLYGLMDPAGKALDGTGLACGIGVDVTANCLGVDIYGESIPDVVLIRLAELDPAGDAIRVQVFTQTMGVLTDEVMKGPVPNSTVEPVFDGARAEPNLEDSEWSIPAEDPDEINELPEKKADAQSQANDGIIKGE